MDSQISRMRLCFNVCMSKKKKFLIAGLVLVALVIVLSPNLMAIGSLEMIRSVCDREHSCDVVPVSRTLQEITDIKGSDVSFSDIQFKVPEGGIVKDSNPDQISFAYGKGTSTKKNVSVTKIPSVLPMSSIYNVTTHDISYFSSLSKKKEILSLLMLKSLRVSTNEINRLETESFVGFEMVNNPRIVTVDIDIADSGTDLGLMFVDFSKEERDYVLSSITKK